jgi:cell wall-associated NlpC family hydrolase
MSPLGSDWRALVVAEARSWIGTPYHHMADVKHHGVDCAMLLVRVYCDTGIAPSFDPRPYQQHFYLHHTDERYLAWVAKYTRRVEHAKPGDLAIYRFGRAAGHGAIIVDDTYMIHSYAPAGRVEFVERRAPLIRGELDSLWSPCLGTP